MRTSFKKLTSIFLAVLMLVSAFSVVTASAAETGKAPTGESNITVDVSGADDPDNPSSWYAWTWDGVEDHWVSGYGDDATAVHFDGVGGYVKFVRMAWGSEPNWDTAWNQTGDIAVTGSSLRFFWTQNYGEVGYEWTEGGDDNPGGGGGEEGYNPGPGNGPHTVVLDASGVDTGYVDWRAWTWVEGSEGYWVGATGTDASDITYKGLEDNVVFAYFTPGSNNGWDGKIGQTVNLTVDGSTFTVTKAEAGDGGVEGSWSGSSDLTGDATVYLNPGEVTGDWMAWSFDGGMDGQFISGSQDGDLIKFDGVSSNVIFVNTTDGGWTGRVGQTASEYTQDGGTYTLDGSAEPTTNEFGESFDQYGGSWGDGPQPDTQETEPDTQETEPDTQETQPQTDETQPDTQETQPQTDETQPGSQETQAPTGDVQPDTTVPGGDSEDGPLTAVIKLNGAEVKKQEVYGDTLKVTYNVTCPELVVDGQASLTYNKEKLTLESWEFPVVDASVIDNLDEGLFNFSSVKKPYDFTKGDKLVVCNFKVTDGAKGEASINLQIEEFDSADTVYAANSQITADGQAIIDSMKNVDVDAGTPATQATDSTEPTTGEEQPSTGGDVTEPTTQPDTQVTEPTQQPTTAPVTQKPTSAPATQPATQAPTKAPTPTVKPVTPAVKPASSLKNNPNADAAVAYVKALKNDKDPSGSTFSNLKANAKKVTKSSVKVTWSKVKGAKKYIVMGNKCGSAYKQLKTTTSKSFTQKGLKKGTYYKYMILAVNAKNKVIATSKTLHVATKGGKVGNYKSVKITNAKSTYTIKKGKKFTLKAKAKKADKKVKNHRKII